MDDAGSTDEVMDEAERLVPTLVAAGYAAGDDEANTWRSWPVRGSMVRESLVAIPEKPQDEVQLGFAEQRLDRAHDRLLAADLDSIPDFERLLAAEMAGRDHLAAAAELIAILDPSHRGQDDTRSAPISLP
jgi:hypothetical protein